MSFGELIQNLLDSLSKSTLYAYASMSETHNG